MDRPQCFCEEKVLGRFLFQTCLLTACSDFRKTVFDEIIVFKFFGARRDNAFVLERP